MVVRVGLAVVVADVEQDVEVARIPDRGEGRREVRPMLGASDQVPLQREEGLLVPDRIGRAINGWRGVGGVEEEALGEVRGAEFPRVGLCGVVVAVPGELSLRAVPIVIHDHDLEAEVLPGRGRSPERGPGNLRFNLVPIAEIGRRTGDALHPALRLQRHGAAPSKEVPERGAPVGAGRSIGTQVQIKLHAVAAPDATLAGGDLDVVLHHREEGEPLFVVEHPVAGREVCRGAHGSEHQPVHRERGLSPPETLRLAVHHHGEPQAPRVPEANQRLRLRRRQHPGQREGAADSEEHEQNGRKTPHHVAICCGL